ncbi:MAG: TonB family protein [Desulfoplanes sp.]
MKTHRRVLLWAVLAGSALGLNALMCMIAPLLSGSVAHPSLEGISTPIMLSAPPRLPEKKEHRALKKPEPLKPKETKIPKLIFKERMQQYPRPKLRFKAPSFEVAMANQISPGMLVAPPLPDAPPGFGTPGPGTGEIGFELGELDTPPVPIHRARPVYPFKARRKGITGKVTVRFLVTSTGMVDNMSIVHSEPEKIFDQSVLDCIAKWRFKPGMFEGNPVATWVVLPISFKL